MWRIYLQKREYELAKQYCRDNDAHLDEVETAHAQHLFDKKEYELGVNNARS